MASSPETMADDDDWCDEDDAYDASLDCDHAEADVDLMTGELSCRCGYHRYLSGDELRREAQLQAEMMEAYSRECEQSEQDANAASTRPEG